MSIEVLRSPWEKSLNTLVDKAKVSLLICSPYIGRNPCVQLARRLQDSGRCDIDVQVLTDLSCDNVISGATDVGGLVNLCEAVPHTVVRILPRLHAKVYVADTCCAVVTSGNFTDGGVFRNKEYGIFIDDQNLVSRVRSDICDYASIGSVVPIERLKLLESIAIELSSLQASLKRSWKSAIRDAYEVKVKEIEGEILQTRVKGMGSHAVFADTIVFLLKQEPLDTRALYREISVIHPDLCDDDVKLVVSGQVWSQAKWRHRVRHAQLYLARQGQIVLEEGIWRIVDKATR